MELRILRHLVPDLLPRTRRQSHAGLRALVYLQPSRQQDPHSPDPARKAEPSLPNGARWGLYNLHHPLWDDFDRYEDDAEHLLQLALQWDLDLRTPRGTRTRAPQGNQHGRPSTIDHFWASTDLPATYYGLDTRGKSDHYPQVLEVDLNLNPHEQPQPNGWNWKKMDAKRVEAEAALLPVLTNLDDDGPKGLQAQIQTTAELSQAFD